MCTDTHNNTGTHTRTCKDTRIRTRTFIQIIAHSEALYGIGIGHKILGHCHLVEEGVHVPVLLCVPLHIVHFLLHLLPVFKTFVHIHSWTCL
jgi:hypothetical protein